MRSSSGVGWGILVSSPACESAAPFRRKIMQRAFAFRTRAEASVQAMHAQPAWSLLDECGRPASRAWYCTILSAGREYNYVK